MTATQEEIARLYAIIANRELDDPQIDTRAQIVHQLEQATAQSFLNTKDFHAKMTRFLDSQPQPTTNP